MRVVDILTKKRCGDALTKTEISFLLNSYLKDEIPEYQISAFLMAVVFQGMTSEELLFFTQTMTNSGDTLSLPNTNRFIIDKHSTGGVGDKTSIALAPLLASLDLGVAKLSGRGLGHTGGTIDKFESIAGFKFMTHAHDMITILEKTGIGLMGYSDKIVPLDKKLYSLRDVTSTVESVPLIASSIMSKKLAVESDAIVLDVKVGNGAFMTTIEEARELAHTMCSIGKGAKRKIACVLTNMNQPLGYAIGNSLELIEAIETLKGNGPKDFTDIVLMLAGVSLFLRGDVQSIEDGKAIASKFIGHPAPLKHLEHFIQLSGGNKAIVQDYTLLPQSTHTHTIYAKHSGFIHSFNTLDMGNAAMIIGAGRATKTDVIDPAVGIISHTKQGDTINKGDALATIHYNNEKLLKPCATLIEQSINISTTQGKIFPLIFDTLL